MDLTKFLKRMKNTPERFSNLAFWREVRKLKTNIVATFKNVENWGNNVENVLRNLNRSFGHDNFPHAVVELESNELKKISIVTMGGTDSQGSFTTGYIKITKGDLHVKEVTSYNNTISIGTCDARLDVELSDHTHTMLPLGVYIDGYKNWHDPAPFTFKFHFYCNDIYDSYFPVNPRLSVVSAKIIFDCDALQLSVAI